MYLDNKIIKEDMESIYNRDIDWTVLDGKTIFVSGAYGMITSYIVYFFMYLNIQYGINVRVIAQGRNREKAFQRFYEIWEQKGFEFSNVDICKLMKIDGKIDYIIHGAGVANPRLYSTNPVEVMEPNLLGTYYLLKLAVEKKCDSFLLFSTGDIYGTVDDPSNIDETTVGKMDPLDIHSCYGESKRVAETLCASFTREYDIRTNMARIGHTYGPTMDVKSDPRVFASFLRCAVESQDIVMQSDGRAKRPFCYLADAVFAYLLILLKGKEGEAYNVCNTEQFFSVKELADIVASIPDNKLSVVFKARNDEYVENKLNSYNKPIEMKLKELGWTCKFDLKEGMTRTYQVLKENIYEKVNRGVNENANM